MADSAWPSIHAERRALTQDLAGLTSAQWSTPSLCAGWTVHQVLTHQVATATLAAFRAVETATSSPPGPKDSWLGEDIRRPLSLHRDYPLPAVTRAITFHAGSNAIIGGKKHVAGLTLRATDTDFAIGSGPEVTWPGLATLRAR